MGFKNKIAIFMSIIVFASCMLSGCGNDKNTTSNSDNSSQQSNQDTTSPTKISEEVYGYVQKSAKADVSYFDGVVFVGDSVSKKLELYNDTNDVMGKAKFLTAGSLSYGNALWDLDTPGGVFPTYQGDITLIEDGISAMGAKKAYIMLGMNDVGVYGVDQGIENMKELTARILEKSPDVKIYIQSVTPILEGFERSDLNNQYINEFNDKLCKVCEDNQFYFVDVASVMKDENGYLPLDYCSDPEAMGIHFTDEACAVWVDYLLTHTK